MATRLFSDIIGSAQVVPVVGVLESVSTYTIGGTTTPPTPGTGATFFRETYCFGNVVKVRFEFNQTVAGSAGSGIYTLPLSNVFTVDTLRVGKLGTSGNLNYCGSGAIQAGSNAYQVYASYSPSLNAITIEVDNQGASGVTYADWGSGSQPLSNTTVRLSVDVFLPITASALVAQGAGLATSTKSGLVTNAIAPTNLISTDLTSQTNCTIDPGDVVLCRYSMTNSTVLFVLRLDTISVAGTPASISFTLPAAVPRPSLTTVGSFVIYDNTSGPYTIGSISVNTSGVVSISKASSATFATSTNNTYVYGQISWMTT